MIKAKDVVFEYQKYDEEGNVCETKRAVDGVELDVKKGDFVAILGHNGSGKSTLAKHINALLLPNEGEVWVAGMNTKEEIHGALEPLAHVLSMVLSGENQIK